LPTGQAPKRAGAAWALTAALALLYACDYEIEEGSYAGLEIGSSKAQTLDALIDKGVPDILPIVDEALSARAGDEAALTRVIAQQGVCVNAHRHPTFRFGFDVDGSLAYRSEYADTVPALESPLASVQIGASREAVAQAIRAMMSKYAEAVAFNCIADVDWVAISEASPDAYSRLEPFNSWSYHEPDAYSRADLRFADGRLVRIDYHWRPFEE
jgi:hypothetical protein